MEQHIFSLNDNEKFIYSIGLAKRFNENFLSDLVWAEAITDDNFKKEFVRYCTNYESEDNNIVIKREVDQKENGRNDFHIITPKGLYVIENKINDKNTDRLQGYLNTVGNDKTKLTYIVPRNWNGEKTDDVVFVHWESFIESIHDRYRYFSIIASSVLGIKINADILSYPSKDDVSDFIKLCDKFRERFFINDKYIQEKEDNSRDLWNGIDLAYGYTCWASVWFGIIYCPLKGLIFCFSYGKGGEKDICPHKTFKYITPLGNYKHDEYEYYQVKISIDKIRIIDLDNAFKEFASQISVTDSNGNKIELLKYINYGNVKL